MHKLIYLKSN